MCHIGEVADKLETEGGIAAETVDEFMRLYQDPTYWTMAIAFTGVTAQKRAV